MAPMENQAVQQPPKSGSRTGCCIFGCLGTLFLVIVVCIAGVFFAKQWVNGYVEKLASNEKVEFAPLTSTQEEIDASIKEVDLFRDDLVAGRKPAVLRLSDEDINNIITNHPKFQEISDKVRVRIEDGEITADFSIDLESLGGKLPISINEDAGRYINGSASISVGMVGGSPVVLIKGLSANGMSLPGPMLQALKEENILKEERMDPDMKAFFGKFQDIRVEGDELILVPKKQ